MAKSAGFDFSSNLFPPDFTVLERFNNLRKNVHSMEPEKRLIFAVIQDSVEDFQKFILPKNDKEKNRFTDAETWIYSGDEKHVFGFHRICGEFGLEPTYLQKGLVKWKEEALAEYAKNGGKRK